MLTYLLFGIVIAYGIYEAVRWRNLPYDPSSGLAEPLFPMPIPTHILYGHNPPLRGGRLITKTLKQFEKEEKIRWTNVPVASPKVLDRLEYDLTDAKDENNIPEFNDFVICKINNNIGKGVFANKPIKQETILGIYVGLMEYPTDPNRTNNVYCLNSGTPHTKNVDYEARYYRNMTAYIQHAPTESLIHETDVMTANIRRVEILQGGIPMTLFVAKRDIGLHEQLLLDYGKAYWENCAFHLFDKVGRIVATRLACENSDEQRKSDALRKLFEESPEPLFHAVNPTHILCGNLGEPLTQIPIEKFEKQERITWTNTPFTGQIARMVLFSDEHFPRKFSLSISEGLCKAFDQFAICHINDIAGKGVVYIPPVEKNESLPAGTTLGIYSGLLESADTAKGFCVYGYEFSGSSDALANSIFEKLSLGIPFFDAQHYRNAISYLQHAPNNKNLAGLNISDEIKTKVATANVGIIETIHLGIPVLCAVTLRPIQPGEQLLLDYNSTYFDDKPYQLFDKTGNVVATIEPEN